MIEAFVRIVDRLISLLEIGQARRRTLLVEVIEPIFKDLEEIHREYLVVLSAARERCADDVKALNEVIPELRKSRLLKEPDRERLIATCDRLLEKQWQPEVEKFLEAVRDYFQLQSPIAELVDPEGDSFLPLMTRGRGEEKEVQEVVLKVFDAILGSLRAGWSEVARNFAAVKARNF